MMTKVGFFSTVRDNNHKWRVIVRARDREDLVRLRDLMPLPHPAIERTPQADYPFRMRMSKRRFQTLAARLARGIDYGNFKDAVKASDPERAEAYTRVWSVLRARLDEREKGPAGVDGDGFPDIDYGIIGDVRIENEND